MSGTALDEEPVEIHTDGACSGNPGPAGIGVFFERPDGEISLWFPTEIVQPSRIVGLRQRLIGLSMQKEHIIVSM